MVAQITHQAKLIQREDLGGGQRMLTFLAPDLARLARPGQFVAFSVMEHFLRRPLGIAAVDLNQGTFSVGGRPKGSGMARLLALKEGETVSVLGPLGNGFQPVDNQTAVLVVGGGTGVYPLHYYLGYLKEKQILAGAAFGFKSANDAVLTNAFKALTPHCLIASESGDLDLNGNVMVALKAVYRELLNTAKKIQVVACGPIPMMQAVADFAAAKHLACQVSLEARMACGVGLCLGCACQTKDPQTEVLAYARCCYDGPVFDAQQVIWE